MPDFNTLVLLAVTALMAYFIKRLSSRIGLPIVTGYVIIGVVLGMSLLNVIKQDALNHLGIINEFALGLIGFTIGTELRRDVFRELGLSIILIALFEAVMAFVLVSGVLLIIPKLDILPYQALLLGAIASATAPAATVYVIQQYKAKGPLTSTIMAVVGIDDAFALMIFVFASALAKGILNSTHITVFTLIFHSIRDIGLSIILGGLTGFIFTALFKRVRFPDDLILGCVAFILLNLGIASHFHLSGMLSVMAFGAVVTNLNHMLSSRSSRVLESFSPILYACFFIFGGAHLNFKLLPEIGLIGLVYFLSRAAGKVGGATLGAWIGRASLPVRKNVGLALIPQVGVAIALAIMVQREFGGKQFTDSVDDFAVKVINILLFTTIITEFVGPLLTKWAITRAGEKGQAN